MSDFDPNDRGEYPIGPEPAPNPRPFGAPRVKVRTSMLDHVAPAPAEPIPYARRTPIEEPPPSISTGWQYFLGLIAPYAYGGLIAGIIYILSTVGAARVEVVTPIIWFGVFGFIVLVAFVRVRLRWTGLIPGLLTAIFVLPLILFVVCGVVVFTAMSQPGAFH